MGYVQARGADAGSWIAIGHASGERCVSGTTQRGAIYRSVDRHRFPLAENPGAVLATKCVSKTVPDANY
jgi:hypothetical protein